LRRDSKEDAPLSERAMPKTLRQGTCGILGVAEKQRDLLSDHEGETTEEKDDIPVRVVARRGDWIKIILPRAEAPSYRCMDGALVSWAATAAGWARAAEAGPVPHTRVLSWRTQSWGAWP